MKFNLANLVSRHRTADRPSTGSGSTPARARRSLLRTGTLALALTAAAASLAVLAPASANASGSASPSASGSASANAARNASPNAVGNAVEIVSGWNGTNGPRVDVMWASQAPTAGAFLWPDNASLSQEFNLLSDGNGFYRIQARHSGQCLILDWRSATYTNGSRILQYPNCRADYLPGQWTTKWIWRPNGCTGQCFVKGTWYALIKNERTGKCLDAANGAGGQPPVQAVLQQWDCITSPFAWNAWNQMWTFAPATSQLGPGPH